MPFGEELYTGVGGLTGDTGLKYSSNQDDIRQKFTGYQKDEETQLDFAVTQVLRRMEKGCRSGSPKLLKILVARDGIEPPTRGFSVRCSTN